ncbi:MAG: thioredoxin family protein [Planctomycetes bacterium]|nr:thioredoxin family protein [Planctomycetota bacterium]
MPVTPSSMVPIGTQMPPFSLATESGAPWSPQDNSAGTLVVFMCNHCPFVVHIASTLVQIHALCEANSISMVGINSNNIQTHPDDAPDKMILCAQEYGWNFPYLFDETQKTAKAFAATCTPDTFLYGSDGKLFYRGQFDDSRPNQGISDGRDLQNAIHALVSGDPPPEDQQPSIGCNIKWR